MIGRHALATAAIAGALGFGAALPAQAQDKYPSRPIRLLVPFPAGGPVDVMGRLIAQHLSTTLGQQVIVDNRPGAGSTLAAKAAATAEPDGYTLLVGSAATLAIGPTLYPNAGYDPKLFAPVGFVSAVPYVMIARAQLPVKTVPELIAHAKANPGKLNFATDGAKNFSGMLAAWINKLGGMDIPQVPYSTMPQGAQDTLAGRVQLTILAIPSAAPLIESGKLNALAISMPKRAPGFETVPTVAETFPGFDLTGWMMVSAPAGTPADIMQRFNRELDAVMKAPEMVKRLRDIGFYTDGAGTLAEASAFVKDQYAAWGRVVADIGLKPE